MPKHNKPSPNLAKLRKQAWSELNLDKEVEMLVAEQIDAVYRDFEKIAVKEVKAEFADQVDRIVQRKLEASA